MKNTIYIIIILVVSSYMASNDQNLYKPLESIIASTLSAILGGLIAAIAIIAAVLSTSKDKTKMKADNSSSYNKFIYSLGLDIKLLLMCLVFSVLLPMARGDNIILNTIKEYSKNAENHYNYIITTLEIGVFVLAAIIIYEIIEVLISILLNMMKL